MTDRIETHRAMATRMYGTQARAHETGVFESHGAWTADGQIHEPWEITLFSPKRGDWTMLVDRMDFLNPSAEFGMYWNNIPDFGIKWYEVFPHERGWICRMRYEGTTKQGAKAIAHQVDFATVDDKGRVVRMEWYVDQVQWNKVWALASGRTTEQIAEQVATLGGWDEFLAEVNAEKAAREQASATE